MNNIKMIITIISLVLLSGCGFTNSTSLPADEEINNDNLERIVIHGNYFKHEDEKEMNADADLIVIASSNDSFLNREHVATYTPAEGELSESLEDFYTKNTIKIKDILKSEEGSDIKIGSEIDVIEPVAIVETGEGKQILTTENYLEMEEDTDYIIYLKRNTYGEYGVINMNNGRFNLESEDQIVNLNEHNHDNDKEEHEAFKKDVFERYAEEIEDY